MWGFCYGHRAVAVISGAFLPTLRGRLPYKHPYKTPKERSLPTPDVGVSKNQWPDKTSGLIKSPKSRALIRKAPTKRTVPIHGNSHIESLEHNFRIPEIVFYTICILDIYTVYIYIHSIYKHYIYTYYILHICIHRLNVYMSRAILKRLAASSPAPRQAPHPAGLGSKPGLLHLAFRAGRPGRRLCCTLIHLEE